MGILTKPIPPIDCPLKLQTSTKHAVIITKRAVLPSHHHRISVLLVSNLESDLLWLLLVSFWFRSLVQQPMVIPIFKQVAILRCFDYYFSEVENQPRCKSDFAMIRNRYI